MVEVYPLAALVRLLGYRPLYKAAKTRKYWPEIPLEKRIDALLESWRIILEALNKEIVEVGFRLPERSSIRTLSQLKASEDMLDAIICAWIASLFLEGKTEPSEIQVQQYGFPKPLIQNKTRTHKACCCGCLEWCHLRFRTMDSILEAEYPKKCVSKTLICVRYPPDLCQVPPEFMSTTPRICDTYLSPF